MKQSYHNHKINKTYEQITFKLKLRNNFTVFSTSRKNLENIYRTILSVLNTLQNTIPLKLNSVIPMMLNLIYLD